MAIKQTLHDSLFTLLLLFLNLLTLFSGVEGGKEEPSRVSNGFGFVEKKMLFVFGDSYVDTGNFLYSPSYTPPSGITFPGKPAGRFSDGRVLSDYIASFLSIESPIPYVQRDATEKSRLAYGMNFAHGGTGIFDTLVEGPNLTNQINFFETLIDQGVYTKQDLDSSLALVNAASNDYATFVARNGSDLPVFTASLVNQLSIDLRRIHDLGISKIAVGLLEPLGCLPHETGASSYQKCIDNPNTASINHNKMLLKKVQELKNETGQPPVFLTLDLYNAFLSALNAMQKRRAENSSLMNPLEPCCEGVSAQYTCGSVDAKGENRYKVCENPETSFFWDQVHLSQNGWLQVYNALQSYLHQLSQNFF